MKCAAHVTEDLFWGSPGRTEEQTAAWEKMHSSRSWSNNDFPPARLPTDAASWTASLCVPESSAPEGGQTTTHRHVETPTGDVTHEELSYTPALASPAMESDTNVSLWISGRQTNLLQEWVLEFSTWGWNCLSEEHQSTHQGNVLQTADRQEEEEPVHLTESCLVPVLHWAERKHHHLSPSTVNLHFTMKFHKHTLNPTWQNSKMNKRPIS